MQYFQYIITILFVDRIHSTSCRFETTEISNTTNTNVKKLSVVNNNLLEIKRETFNKYRNLQQLNIINSKVYSVAEKAFYDLPYLRELNLTQNFITNLNSNMFRPLSKLRKLVVSFNKLNAIDNFEVDNFPELTFVDISNNQLRSLPQSLLDKLENDDNFTLIADNNLWDCENDKWTRYLSEKLHLKLCLNARGASKNEPEALVMKVPPQASFITCIFWICGAFWIGVIVGNICLIKRVVFSRKVNFRVDESTQYDSVAFYSAHDIIRINKNLTGKSFPTPPDTSLQKHPSVTTVLYDSI